jgi:hypothetical protein
MRKFKTKNAAFAGEYASAQLIIELGTRHEKEPAPAAKAAWKNSWQRIQASRSAGVA